MNEKGLVFCNPIPEVSCHHCVIFYLIGESLGSAHTQRGLTQGVILADGDHWGHFKGGLPHIPELFKSQCWHYPILHKL